MDGPPDPKKRKTEEKKTMAERFYEAENKYPERKYRERLIEASDDKNKWWPLNGRWRQFGNLRGTTIV